MSITLAPSIEHQIQLLVETGQYPDADAVVQNALQALEAQVLEHDRFVRLQKLVRDGFESGDRVELTDELWDEMERRATERFQRGEKPSSHVCP